MGEERTRRFLFGRAAGRVCALPLEHVDETLRPLPLESVAHAPTCVIGVSVIRGRVVPVVDAGLLLGSARANATRFVTLEIGERRVALALDAVLGVRELADAACAELPPLLRDADAAATAAIAALDRELLVVLDGARIVPDARWAASATRDASTAAAAVASTNQTALNETTLATGDAAR